MSSSETLEQTCQEICNACINCGECVTECLMLKQIGEDIPSIATRKPTVDEAFSCSLCGLCEAVCPSSLSPKRMFIEARMKAVENSEIPIDNYRYMFPDRDLTVMSAYRELNGIRYDEFEPDEESEIVFFPGCTMLSYSPELTKAIFNNLALQYKGLSLLMDCCGLPLYQLGLKSRGNNYVSSLMTKLTKLKVKKLIVACPNCYYQLRPFLKDTEITLMTIYEALSDSVLFNKRIEETASKVVTVHDSCPDRFEGIFASQARNALLNKGYQWVEMEHSQKMAVCCGSGGQISHFRPDLGENLVKSRVDEAEDSGAQILTAYCLGCVLNLSKVQGATQAQHVLNLLLELELDFQGLKAKSKSMFEGPEGEELWAKIMAE